MTEKKQAKKDKARLVKNSGRGLNKGDAELQKFLIDYKETDASSFTISLEKFKKHELDAIHIQKEAVIVVIFKEHNGRALAVVDWEILKDLVKPPEESPYVYVWSESQGNFSTPQPAQLPLWNSQNFGG